jgi:hypothetical protein
MTLRVADLEPSDWIRNGVLPLLPAETPGWKGNTVAHCIPKVFASYVKVFHPIFEDQSVMDKSLTWNDAEGDRDLRELANSLSSSAIEALMKNSVLTRGSSRTDTVTKRVRWCELAKRYGLQFNPTITDQSFTRNFPGQSWPRYLIGPEEGTLDTDSTWTLANVLDGFAGHRDAYFMYSAIATRSWDCDLLYRAPLSQLSHVMQEAAVLTHGWNTPTYWWSSDQNWCVYTSWDLTFTLVAGPTSIASAVLSADLLECVEVEPHTRVDYKSDHANLGGA